MLHRLHRAVQEAQEGARQASRGTQHTASTHGESGESPLNLEFTWAEAPAGLRGLGEGDPNTNSDLAKPKERKQHFSLPLWTGSNSPVLKHLNKGRDCTQ